MGSFSRALGVGYDVIGALLTGIVFTLELTHTWPALFPLITRRSRFMRHRC